MRVLIMAGGTGGHIMPGLAYAEALRQRGAEVHWLGAPQSMEERLVTAARIGFSPIRVSGVRGKGWRARIAAPWMLLRSALAAMRVILRLRPHLAMGFGGYVAAPGGLGAALLRVPLMIHEQNARAGSTNRFLAPLAAQVLAAYPGAFAARRAVDIVGNPVRAEILALPGPDDRPAADGPRLRVLILGGSQGARVLNHLVPEALALLSADDRPQVRHQGGRSNDEAEQAYARAGLDVQPESFIADMPGAYAAADLVICRAGALTLAEVMAVGLPAICIPLPGAIDDHQTANARHLVEAGGGWLLPERSVNAADLADLLRALHHDRAEVHKRACASRAAARRDTVMQMVERSFHIAGVGRD